ncbi:MAG: thioredoxin reductase [Solirubrobacteraceae bacterium]|jgi:thioredoxin reductase (NADPH)|nr:thioredoxin reductase [Solirubrobacteraceae bacterium]
MTTTPEPEALEETPDLYGAYPRLSPEQIQALAALGERRETHAGEVLYQAGDTSCDFFVILDGKIAIVEGHGTDEERIVAVHGAGRFVGELGLLTGQPVFLSAVAREAGAVVCVPTECLRDLVANDSTLGDVILRALLLRRSILVGLGTGFRIIGSRFSPDTRRLREFAARNRLPHRWIDLEQDPAAERLLRALGIGPEDTPVVILRGSEVLRNPRNQELARKLGMLQPVEGDVHCDLLVVGAGPAGLAACVYGASEGLSTIALEGVATGGQAGTSSRIENYLGFPAGISGAELAERAEIQAQKFGARINVSAEATAIEPRAGGYAVTYGDGDTVQARSVVIATGARYRKLPIPRLEDFEGISIYYAATVAEAQMCAGDPVVVIGGGNSAGQATLFLSDYVPLVHLVVREPDLGQHMSRYLADRIQRMPNVEVHTSTEVRELLGDKTLEAVVVEHNATGERDALKARSMFVFIGAKPHTSWLGGLVDLDEGGYIHTGRDAAAAVAGNGEGPFHEPLLLETSQPGMFAVGDVRSGSIKRVATAVGEGSMAVRLVYEHLAGHRRADRMARQPTQAAAANAG